MARTRIADILSAFVVSSRDKGLLKLKSTALTFLENMPDLNLIVLKASDATNLSTRLTNSQGFLELQDSSGLTDWFYGVGKVAPVSSGLFVHSSNGINYVSFDGNFNLITQIKGSFSSISAYQISNKIILAAVDVSTLHLWLFDDNLVELSSIDVPIDPSITPIDVGIYVSSVSDDGTISGFIVLPYQDSGEYKLAEASFSIDDTNAFSVGAWSSIIVLHSGVDLKSFGADDVIDVIVSAVDKHVVFFSSDTVVSYNLVYNRFDSNFVPEFNLFPWESPLSVYKVHSAGGKILVCGPHVAVYDHGGNKLYEVGATGAGREFGYFNHVDSLFYSPFGLGVISSGKLHFYDRDTLEEAFMVDFPLSIPFDGYIRWWRLHGELGGFSASLQILRQVGEEVKVIDVSMTPDSSVSLPAGEYILRLVLRMEPINVVSPKIKIHRVEIAYEGN